MKKILFVSSAIFALAFSSGTANAEDYCCEEREGICGLDCCDGSVPQDYSPECRTDILKWYSDEYDLCLRYESDFRTEVRIARELGDNERYLAAWEKYVFYIEECNAQSDEWEDAMIFFRDMREEEDLQAKWYDRGRNPCHSGYIFEEGSRRCLPKREYCRVVHGDASVLRSGECECARGYVMKESQCVSEAISENPPEEENIPAVPHEEIPAQEEDNADPFDENNAGAEEEVFLNIPAGGQYEKIGPFLVKVRVFPFSVFEIKWKIRDLRINQNVSSFHLTVFDPQGNVKDDKSLEKDRSNFSFISSSRGRWKAKLIMLSHYGEHMGEILISFDL